MGLNRPMTDAEKALRSEKSKAFWKSEAGLALKKNHGERFSKWNATRHRPLAERQASADRMRILAKTREYSIEERKALSERCKKRMDNGWVRPPMSEKEKESIRQRMAGNQFGAGNKMPDDLKERHRARMKANNPRHEQRSPGPNKAESRLDKIVSPMGFLFVGDGSFWLPKGPSGKRRNPDWIYKDGSSKIAILHHGEYWHRDATAESIAMNDYEFFGWRVLIIWEKENRKMKVNKKLEEKVSSWLMSQIGDCNDKRAA